MNDNDKNRFASAFCTMAEIFGKEPTKIILSGYFEALKKYSIEKVETAIGKAISTFKFFPKPVELIELLEPEKDNIEDIAEIEATKVIEAIKQYGSYQSPKFVDPVTAAVVSNRFGWGHLCSSLTDDKRTWFVKEFKEAYLSMKRSGVAMTPAIEHSKVYQLENLTGKIGKAV